MVVVKSYGPSGKYRTYARGEGATVKTAGGNTVIITPRSGSSYENVNAERQRLIEQKAYSGGNLSEQQKTEFLQNQPKQIISVGVDSGAIIKFNEEMRQQGFNAGTYLQALKAQAAGQKIVYVDKAGVNRFNEEMRQQGINNAGQLLTAMKEGRVSETQQPTTTRPVSNYEKAIRKQEERQAGMAKRSQDIDNFLSKQTLITPTGKKLEVFKQGSFTGDFRRSIARAPYDTTVGFGEQLTSAGEKIYLTGRGLITGEADRKAIGAELWRSAKGTPGEVGKTLNPTTGQGLANVLMVAGGTYLGGKAIKAARNKGAPTAKPKTPGVIKQKLSLLKKDYYFKDAAKTKIMYKPLSKKWINQQLQKTGLKKTPKIRDNNPALAQKTTYKAMQTQQLAKLRAAREQPGFTYKQARQLIRLEKVEAKAALRAKAAQEIKLSQQHKAAKSKGQITDLNTLKQRALSQAKKNTALSKERAAKGLYIDKSRGLDFLRSADRKQFRKTILQRQGLRSKPLDKMQIMYSVDKKTGSSVKNVFDLSSAKGRKAYRNFLLKENNVKRQGVINPNLKKVALDQAKASKKRGFIWNKKGQQQLLIQIEKPKAKPPKAGGKFQPPGPKRLTAAGSSYKGGGLLAATAFKPRAKLYTPVTSVMAGGLVRPKAPTRTFTGGLNKVLIKSKPAVMTKNFTIPKFDTKVLSITKPEMVTGTMPKSKTFTQLIQITTPAAASMTTPGLLEKGGFTFKWPDSSGGSGSRRYSWRGWYTGEKQHKLKWIL